MDWLEGHGNESEIVGTRILTENVRRRVGRVGGAPAAKAARQRRVSCAKGVFMLMVTECEGGERGKIKG